MKLPRRSRYALIICASIAIGAIAGRNIISSTHLTHTAAVRESNRRINTQPTAANVVGTVDPDNPCGRVTVSLISRLLGRPTALAQTRSVLDCDAFGRCSLADIDSALRKLGFCTAMAALSPETIHEGMQPMILHLERGHFVVGRPLRRACFAIADPPNPVRVVSADDPGLAWTGKAVIVAPDQGALASQLDEIGIR